MLLPIYSICNLNTVCWGTREDPRPAEKNDLAKKQQQHIDKAKLELIEAGIQVNYKIIKFNSNLEPLGHAKQCGKRIFPTITQLISRVT